MQIQDIPVYNDPIDFFNGTSVKYPCTTQYMKYDPYQHKYFLTEDALNYYGIDVDRKYVSDSLNKRKEFIDKVTKKVYDYIAYKTGWDCYTTMQYRIAKSYGKMYGQYEFRQQFQEALISQAKYIITNGDSANFSKANLERGITEERPPEQDWMDTSDIAPETKRTLHFLGLDRWFKLVQTRGINTDEY